MTRARWTTTAAVTAVLVAAACAPSSTDTAADREPTSKASPEVGSAAAPDVDPGGSVTAVPEPPGVAIDPAYAVRAPGPRRGAIVPADILLQDTEPLSDEVVRGVRDLDGVLDALPLSVSQVVLENRIYTIAAVDAAQYRRFTVKDSADLQAQWDRVAAGEVAASDTLRKKLPLDDDEFLSLELNPAVPRLHVGAWAPQVEGIDLVVNTSVGEALGMPKDNALVISSGQTSPQTLRAPLARLVGEEISVQNLDVVSTLGLDPDAFQTAVLFGSFADAVGVFNYTPIGGGRIAPDPAWVSSHITTEVVPILGSVTCNKAIMPQLKAALAEVVSQGLESEINAGEYAGCYYPRFIAGSTTLSNHSFGLALDLNVPGNQRGTVGEMDRDVVAIFKYWGFGWGGDWRYTDPMHFELNQIKRPG
ncbi:M15 family metallopeptidase [Nocardioides sp.]|uniref:M15 family metallopeptidase n=1 Tax=Nocardioides sp. TaxID=35761 RepID=UPI0026127B38|nr:M15 family metallopeptidase [Nocardioides sp.]